VHVGIHAGHVDLNAIMTLNIKLLQEGEQLVVRRLVKEGES